MLLCIIPDGHLLPLVAHAASQEYRRVAARSSPRSDGAWGEKIALWFPTMGMCGPAVLAPLGPGLRRPGRHVGNCPDGGGAGTKVHERVSACLWPAPKWWDGPAWRVPGVGSPGPPALFCRGRCVFEFAPRIDPSVACYRSGVFAFGGNKKKASQIRFKVIWDAILEGWRHKFLTQIVLWTVFC